MILSNSEEFRKGVDSIIEKNYKFNYDYTSDMESIAFETGDLYYAFHNANIRVSCKSYQYIDRTTITIKLYEKSKSVYKK